MLANTTHDLFALSWMRRFVLVRLLNTYVRFQLDGMQGRKKLCTTRLYEYVSLSVSVAISVGLNMVI